MHSSRMRTGRSLTVFRSLQPGGVPGPGGGYLVGGGVPGPGGGVPGPGGVYLVPGGVPGPGGCTWSRGVYLVPGGVPGPRGVYLVLGVYLVPGRGGYLVLGGVYLVLGVPGPGAVPGSKGGCTCSGTPPL